MNGLIYIFILISQGFMVQPGRIEVEAVPGQSITKRFIITNISQDTIFLRTHVENFTQDSFGKTIFSPYEGSDVIINPSEFSVPPGDNYTVRVTVKSPDDLNEERWYMIIFSQIPPPLEQFAAIKFVREIGVPFYLIPIGALPEFDIDTSFLHGDTLYFRLKNSGLRHIRARGIFRVFNIDNQQTPVIEEEVKGIFVLPERSIYKPFVIDSLPSGKYIARFRVDFGGPYAIEGVKSFSR